MSRSSPNGNRQPGDDELEQRISRLEEEAGSLAGRLASVGATASLGQLSELTERYAEIQTALREATEEWLRKAHQTFRSSSD